MTTIAVFRVTAALALLGASLPALAAGATATRSWDFKPESNAGLTVRNLTGSIRVERAESPGIRVTATATIEPASQAEADRLLGLIDYRTVDSGANSRLEVRYPREHFPKLYSEEGSGSWWNSTYVEYLGQRIRLVRDRDEAPAARVDIVIRAPAGAKIDAYITFGDAAAANFSGTLRLDGGSGQLSSTGGEGRLVLDSGSGDVTVSGHRGSVDADTGSGAVRITDCECEVTADTGSGSVDLRRGRGSFAADTGSGGVRVEDFVGPLAADTGSGDVRARGVSGVTRLAVDTGSGGVSIDGDLSALEDVAIDTGSGSVSLRSTAQPSLVLRIETGSGGMTVDAPGSSVNRSDDATILRLKDGAGHGDIDAGSGSVDLNFPP